MSASQLWAITSYFNVTHGGRRLANFRQFRKQLSTPLLAVELSFDGIFDLADDDADLVMRISDGDVMWQKERLINIGLAHLPAACMGVAVVDCDILFTNCAWAQRATKELEKNSVVQLFSTVHYLSRGMSAPDPTNETPKQSALGVLMNDGKQLADCLEDVSGHGRGQFSAGIAWAYRRDLLARHGLFQWNIVGGGDTTIAAASVGEFGSVERRHQMTPAHRAAYREWAEPWFEAVQGKISHLPGDVFHLWHGDLVHRQARTRHTMLVNAQYDPTRDVAALEGRGLAWKSDKPELHAVLKKYFHDRAQFEV